MDVPLDNPKSLEPDQYLPIKARIHTQDSRNNEESYETFSNDVSLQNSFDQGKNLWKTKIFIKYDLKYQNKCT